MQAAIQPTMEFIIDPGRETCVDAAADSGGEMSSSDGTHSPPADSTTPGHNHPVDRPHRPDSDGGSGDSPGSELGHRWGMEEDGGYMGQGGKQKRPSKFIV
ncbi:hypothetical protein NP493_936g00003 [Ridgeia piscesae]|uniref:Uncharacterized protein n=1 Tax=Ridgeia piscesae TaxID=27915 RepID=A0AAD9KKA9_RIDPI|nr:hypothetical protein NP493_936g00003 [Ridgeia piscesae]